MKFTTAAATAAVLATGASAQLSQSTPLQIIGYAQLLLSSGCKTALTSVLSSNASLSTCLQTQNLYPILENNSTSVLPDVNAYLTSLCAAPACTPEVISNATMTIMNGCATELSRFGISNGTLESIMGAYPTARKVACLSSNSTQLAANGTIPSSNGTFCPIALLSQVESHLNVSFTNTYVDSLILGANATAYQELLALPQDTQFVNQLGCNDCVAASVNVVLEDYPSLGNKTFKIPESAVANYTNLPLTMNNGTWTVTSLYEGVCAMDVGANATIPASINETAYNVTIGANTTSTALMMTAMSSTSMTSSMSTVASGSATSLAVPTTAPVVAPTQSIGSALSSALASAAPTKRFVRWD